MENSTSLKFWADELATVNAEIEAILQGRNSFEQLTSVELAQVLYLGEKANNLHSHWLRSFSRMKASKAFSINPL